MVLASPPTTTRPMRDLLTVQRWLDYFLPAQYQTTQDSIKIIKATNL